MALVLVEGENQLPALVGEYKPDTERSGAKKLIAEYCDRSVVFATVVVGVLALWF